MYVYVCFRSHGFPTPTSHVPCEITNDLLKLPTLLLPKFGSQNLKTLNRGLLGRVEKNRRNIPVEKPAPEKAYVKNLLITFKNSRKKDNSSSIKQKNLMVTKKKVSLQKCVATFCGICDLTKMLCNRACSPKLVLYRQDNGKPLAACSSDLCW